MSGEPSDSSPSMAHDVRGRLSSARKRTIDRLEAHHRGRAVLDSVLPVFAQHGSPQGFFDTMLQGIMNDVLVPHLDEVARAEAARTVVVTVDQSSVEAVSLTQPDGSHVIRISDAQISLLGLLKDLMLAWSRGHSRFRAVSFGRRILAAHRNRLADVDEMILAGAASVRYYILNQRVEGTSSQVAAPKKVTDRVKVDDGVAVYVALMFLIAHELGHIVLGHTRDRERCSGRKHAHRFEFEADAFGLDLVVRAMGGRDAATLAAHGATVGLLAIAIGSEPLFIRPPETHPAATARIARLVGHEGVDSTVLTALAHGVTRMTEIGIAVERPLDQRCWDLLHSSAAFDTTVNHPAEYRLVRGYDLWLDADAERATLTLRKMHQDRGTPMDDELALVDFDALIHGTDLLAREGPRSALHAWGVRRIDRLTDITRPLSVHELLRAITQGSAFAPPPSPPSRNDGSARSSDYEFLKYSIAMMLTSVIDRPLRKAAP